MSDEIIKKEDLFKVIIDGSAFINEKIKEALEKIIAKSPHPVAANHSMRWDTDDKYFYIYDNECYLFVFDGKIQLRCDRENVFSTDQFIEYPIKTNADIEIAYERFVSMTMEDEEE